MLHTDRSISREHTISRYERLAWLIMLGGFVVFCAIVIGGSVYGYRWWTRPPLGAIQVQTDQELAVLVQRAGLVRLEVLDDSKLNVGDRIEVINDAAPGPAATLRFGSATVQLWAGTKLQVGRLGEQWNDPARATARFKLLSGQMLVEIEDDDQRIEVDMDTGAAPIVVERGRARVRIIEADSPTTAAAERTDLRSYEIAVERGRASFGSISVQSGMKLVETANKQSRGLLTWNLVRDGSFQQFVDDDFPGRDPNLAPSPWKRNVGQTVEGAKDTGQARAVQDCADPIARLDCKQPYVRFVRMGGNDKGFSTAIEQSVNADVSSYRRVRLHANVKVVYQSLSKAGESGTECPLLVRVNYTNTQGDNLQKDFCYWAFEYPGQSGVVSSLPYIESRQIQPDTWHQIDIDLKQNLPNLVKIRDLSFQANGHDYESQVSEVQLVGEGLADLPAR